MKFLKERLLKENKEVTELFLGLLKGKEKLINLIIENELTNKDIEGENIHLFFKKHRLIQNCLYLKKDSHKTILNIQRDFNIEDINDILNIFNVNILFKDSIKSIPFKNLILNIIDDLKMDKKEEVNPPLIIDLIYSIGCDILIILYYEEKYRPKLDLKDKLIYNYFKLSSVDIIDVLNHINNKERGSKESKRCYIENIENLKESVLEILNSFSDPSKIIIEHASEFKDECTLSFLSRSIRLLNEKFEIKQDDNDIYYFEKRILN